MGLGVLNTHLREDVCVIIFYAAFFLFHPPLFLAVLSLLFSFGFDLKPRRNQYANAISDAILARDMGRGGQVPKFDGQLRPSIALQRSLLFKDEAKKCRVSYDTDLSYAAIPGWRQDEDRVHQSHPLFSVPKQHDHLVSTTT